MAALVPACWAKGSGRDEPAASAADPERTDQGHAQLARSCCGLAQEQDRGADSIHRKGVVLAVCDDGPAACAEHLHAALAHPAIWRRRGFGCSGVPGCDLESAEGIAPYTHCWEVVRQCRDRFSARATGPTLASRPHCPPRGAWLDPETRMEMSCRWLLPLCELQTVSSPVGRRCSGIECGFREAGP